MVRPSCDPSEGIFPSVVQLVADFLQPLAQAIHVSNIAPVGGRSLLKPTGIDRGLWL